VKCRVENDERARFWLHNWGGDDTFANLYLRLFSVSLQQNKILCEVGSWENGVWRWCLNWRRPFFAWEEILRDEILTFLNQKEVENCSIHSWDWLCNKSALYLVNSILGNYWNGRWLPRRSVVAGKYLENSSST